MYFDSRYIVSCWHESVVWGKIKQRYRPMCSVSACVIGASVFAWGKIRRSCRKEMCRWSQWRIGAFELSVLG